MELKLVSKFEYPPAEVHHFVKLFTGYGFYVNVENVLRYKADVSTNTEEVSITNKDDVEVVSIITVMNLAKENEND